ncbi:MAG: 5'/3'-nucleotidase SurE [Polyangiaceae bacterium]
MANPLILLSNDDGYASPGIRAMRAVLVKGGADVVVLAPEIEQSASSHSLSLHRPMRLRIVEPDVFALDGTPADCVYVALYAGTRVLARKPDLVVSGINHGMNLGQDAFYSGTIAAAREGALRGIPGVATSAHTSLELGRVAEASAQIALELLRMAAASHPQAHGPLVSLNFPAGWRGELRAARLGTRIYDEIVDFRVDPRDREYLWVGGPGVRHERDAGTDTEAYDEGVASITPLLLDLTDHAQCPMAASLARHVTR